MEQRERDAVEAFPDVVSIEVGRSSVVEAADDCPLCRGGSATPRYSIIGMDHRMLVCTRCGLGRIDPLPRTEEIERFYPDAYYGTKGAKFQPFVELFIRFVAARRLRFLVQGLRRGARVLDVGCGRGVLLQALAERGYEPYGVEISEKAAVGAGARSEIRIATDLRSAGFDAAFFDAVIVWHVLEHLPRPRETLVEIARILKPGGRIVVAVPNYSSWQARWAGAAWFHLDLPRHIYHFPAAALRRLVEETGFEVLSEHHFSLRQNPFGWVQSWLNKRRDLPRNGLYSMLHNPDAGDDAVGDPALRWRLWLAYWLGMPLGLFLSVLAAALRTGATIHFNARKRLDGVSAARGTEGGRG